MAILPDRDDRPYGLLDGLPLSFEDRWNALNRTPVPRAFDTPWWNAMAPMAMRSLQPPQAPSQSAASQAATSQAAPPQAATSQAVPPMLPQAPLPWQQPNLSPQDAMTFANPHPAPMQPAGGFLDNVGNAINNNAQTLMALGGGIMQGGFGRGLEAAAVASSGERRERAQELAKNRTYQAFIARGIPEAEARAAMDNPEILRAMVSQIFAPKNRGFQVIGHDQNGKARYGWVGQPGEVTPYDGSK
jgi:hypothetical protein